MNVAVIFAGGVGTRMHSRILPKQFLTIHGKPIIIHTLELFELHEEIDAIVISCVSEWIDYLEKLIIKYRIAKVRKVVSGGTTGQESIYNALIAAKEISNGENSIVLIHDGVRPLINKETIDDNIAAVKKYGSAITCYPVKETVVELNESGTISAIPNKNNTRLARAPQSFYLNDILDCHAQARRDGLFSFADSCTMMHYYEKELHLIDGPEENIKVTTQRDYSMMRSIFDERENKQLYL